MATIASSVFSQNNVYTQQYDLGRTGWYNKETVLNTQNVRPGSFGKLFSRDVDDQIYAQPLVVQANLPTIGKKNIVIAATVNNSVYAFDADSANITQPYWQVKLTPSGCRVPNRADMTGACGGNYYDFAGNIGIVGTPVIDSSSLTLYVVARSVNNSSGQYYQYLHAIDVATGQEKANSPVLITASVNGTGDGSVNGIITFDPQHQNQRPGLLLSNNVVYITWASHCDWSPYHGWIIGYDATTLNQVIVYNTTPDGYNGGIWMSGCAPSADKYGNIYVGVGNGSAGKNGNISNTTNVAECALKLTPNGSSLSVSSFFTPSDYAELEASDLDVGITNQLLIPNSDRLVAGSKEGKLFLLNRDSLGGYNASSNNVLQQINLGSNAHMHSNLAYYKGSQGEWVYTWSENSLLKAFSYDRNTNLFNVNNTVSGSTQGPVGGSGSFLAVSSNGSVDSTAVLWVCHAASGDANPSTRPGILRAFDANDVTNELWNTSIDSADNVGSYAKFNPPAIANGKIYIGTFSKQLLAYGMLKNVAACNSNNFGLNKAGAASSTDSGSVANAFDGDPSTFWSSASGDNQWVSADLDQRYDLCEIKILWGAQSSSTGFSLQVSDDNQNWKTMINVTGKMSSIHVNGSGRFVRLLGSEGNSSYSIAEFEVYGSLSATQCASPFILPVTNIYGNSATLNWTSIENSSIVQYKTVSANNWNEIETSATSLTLNALACSTDFLYQIKNVCSTNDSSSSSNGSFSTIVCDPNCGRLPTRWSSLDIGNVLAAGEACFDKGVFTLRGSGSDVWNANDEFRYAYRTFVGDGEILARVVTMDNTNTQNKCGVMFRETLATGSRHAFMALTSGTGASFISRETTDGSSANNYSLKGIAPPYWVKLVKKGTTYTGYTSKDTANWISSGNPIDLGFGSDQTPIYVGLALSSHNNGIISTAVLDDMFYTGAFQYDLQNLEADLNIDKTVTVRWTTTLEASIQHFIVQRKEGDGYVNIDTVSAANEGEFTQNYSYVDLAVPDSGYVYYRLCMVSLEYDIRYSTLASVKITPNKYPSLYPNPVPQPGSPYMYVARGSADEPVRFINIYDIHGRVIMQLTNSNSSPTLEIPVTGISNGLYIVEIITSKTNYKTRVVIRN